MSNPDPIVTAWVTKYALTRGYLMLVNGQHCVSIDPSLLSCDHSHDDAYGNEWHLSEQNAFKRAEEMRVAKIEALKKQIYNIEKHISKIQNMQFFVIDCRK